jgi:hypothetical protein
MTPLRVVLDDWAQPPEPEPLAVQFQLDDGLFRRQLILDAALAARVQVPGPLILVTGV